MNEMIQNNSKKFCMEMLYRQLPASIIVAFTMAFSDMADALVLGNRIGEIGLATIAISAPIYMIMNIIIQSLGNGASIRYAKFMAEGKKDDALENYRSAIAYSIGFGVLIALIINIGMPIVLAMQGVTDAESSLYSSAATYLGIVSAGSPIIILSFVINDFMRNEDMEKQASMAASVGNFLDIILNILFVLVLRFGVVGAAFATVTGKTISLFISFVTIIIKKSDLRHIFGKTRISHVPLGFRTGGSTVLRYVSDMLFFIGVNFIIMKMVGSSGVAVFDIIQNVSYILMYLYLAFAEAGQPAISTYTGEMNTIAKKTLKKETLKLGQIFTGVFAIAIFVFAAQICNVFGLNPETTALFGESAIRIYVISAPIMGISLILEGYYQASYNIKGAYLISFLRSFAVLFPVTIILSFTNIEIFFAFYLITEILSLIVFMIYAKKTKLDEGNVDENKVYRYVLDNDSEKISRCCEAVGEFCEEKEANPKQQYFVQMAIEELVGAIINHSESIGNENVICEITVVSKDDGSILLFIRDNALSFNPFEINCDGSEIENEDMIALGVNVIRSKANEFFYRRYQGFNSLIVKI